MDAAPELHWATARAVAKLGRGDLPAISRSEAHRYVASVRRHAREAAELAATAMQFPACGASHIRVVDRDGWVAAATNVAQAAIDSLGWPRRAPTPWRALTARVLGAGVGAGLGVGSRWMLGQYDAFSGSRTLYLVAPNLWRMQHRNGFDERSFLLWVAAHEQAHALQFDRAPWLVGYLGELVRDAGSRASIDRIIATMTFLEGHADYVSDRAARISNVQRMRRVLERSRPQRGGGLFDKGTQYAQGRMFCLKVQQMHADAGPDAPNPLDVAFDAAENLPTREEIANPALWDRRVHG